MTAARKPLRDKARDATDEILPRGKIDAQVTPLTMRADVASLVLNYNIFDGQSVELTLRIRAPFPGALISEIQRAMHAAEGVALVIAAVERIVPQQPPKRSQRKPTPRGRKRS